MNYSFAIDALTLEPSDFCNNGVDITGRKNL